MNKIAHTMQLIWLQNKEQGLPFEQTLEDITAYLKHASPEEIRDTAEGFKALREYVLSFGAK